MDVGVVVAVTKGVAVGVGRSVTSTVVSGVGVAGVGRQAANRTTTSIITETRAKTTFLFMYLFRLLLCVFFPINRLICLGISVIRHRSRQIQFLQKVALLCGFLRLADFS